MKIFDLINICNNTYYTSSIQSGKDNINGANLQEFDNNIVLSLRGTLTDDNFKSVLDWINDFHAELIKTDEFPGLVHEGFYNSFKSLLPLINIPNSAKQLIITGHSKGGGIAQLCGWYFQNLRPIVITFAAPKIFSNVTSSIISTKVNLTRYEKADDIVPLVPPFGYGYAGKLICSEDQPINYREWCVTKLFAEGQFAKLLNNHHLDTGYLSWIQNVDI